MSILTTHTHKCGELKRIMQIRENLLRVIFMLSTIVAVTDCCSSRILLLKEHTLQIVNEQRFQGEDYDYEHDDYDQLQQLQQQQQLPKIPQHIVIASNIEFNKNYTDEHTNAHNTDDPGGQEPAPVPLPDLQISLGIFDPSAYEPTPSSTPSAAGSTPRDDAKKLTPDAALHVVDIMSIPCSGQYFTDFCLNRGRCFRYLVGNDTLHSCICADGYVGERCESKSYNGAFIPAIASANKQRKILMARIVFSFPMLVAISVIYIMIGAAIVFKRTPRQPRAAGGLEHDEQERVLLCSANMD